MKISLGLGLSAGTASAAPAGNISVVASLAPSTVNFTTLAYQDWVLDLGAGAGVYYRKGTIGVPVGLITVTDVNLTYPGWSHGLAYTINTDAGDATDAGAHAQVNAFGHDQAGAGDAKLQMSFPAASATHHAYIYFQPDTTDAMTLRLTLSDASYAEQVISVPAQGSETSRLYTVTYNSAGAGTLLASLETGAGLSTHSYFLFSACAYKAS